MSLRRKRPSLRTKKVTGFASKYEQSIWDNSLDQMREATAKRKRGLSYENDVLEYVLPQPSKKYYPDFTLHGPGGTIYIEAKGRFTRQDRKKMEAVLECNPGIDLRMLFMVDQPILKGSPTRYSKWCDDRGIIYSVGYCIPVEWAEEINCG